MAKIIIIAAVAQNNVIGNKGGIPWHIKEDFAFFQRTTMGYACIMGDRTYDSLPAKVRPLPGRENIILTRNDSYQAPGATILHSWQDMLSTIKDREKVFLCGGATVYSLGLACADELYITHVQKSFEGDTFFPDIDNTQWQVQVTEKSEGKNLLTDETIPLHFVTYVRK